ncbi:helix-turn-helix transcriptional regulator [Bradyrhizobium sp. Arg816]|uniref:helix-turn-helix transcriptional regulator n=1 Tax=Bradyrhizobium sp. Arg816 TaxID=2998491 RepID=UPI00249F91C5|nr:helix-turn-helix transcriptional regulator [Bradyrhizobium sp. Arg816]MDI3559232.1 helix-turn-helix transcriptional regulator [Bradyrhizobium sp. Arg816]
MSQPISSRQPKHGYTQATVAADETDFRSAITMASIAPLPKVIAPAIVSGRDDLSPLDATTIAFERLGLVIAIEGRPRRSSSISPCNPARDTTPNSVTTAPICNDDDPVVQRLSEALVAVERLKATDSALCVDALRFAVIARLLALRSEAQPKFDERARVGQCSSERPVQGLQRWRLKRVLDYIETHFRKKIVLADLAAAAGLSRMHFAAQFRAATGCRPHEYILRHRIQRSKDLLLDCEMPIVEIALTVGFQSQAHFTTTFRRFAGDTPSRWRDAAAAGVDL